MKTVKYTLFYIFIILSAVGQEYVPHTYGASEGLKSPSIFCLFKDSKGYIWLGTNTGAARFDGKDFEYFEIKNGLTGYSVYQIHEDSKGRIWFLTDSGEPNFYLDGEIHSPNTDHYLKELSMPSFLYGFHEDDQGSIWIGSFNSGYKVLTSDNNVYGSETTFENNKDRRVGNIWSHLPGRILISSSNSFICLDSESKKIIWRKTIFESEGGFMRCIQLNTREFLFFSGKEGLVFNVVQKKITARISLNGISEVIQIRRVDNGDILIGTRNGLYKFDNNKLVKHELFNDLRNHAVSDVLKDGSQNFWVSTLNNGFHQFHNFLIKKDIRFKDVTEPLHAINIGSSGELLVGTEDKGFYTYTDKLTFRPIKNEKSKIQDIIELGKDTTLIIAENRAYVLEKDQIYSRGVAIKGIRFIKESGTIYLTHLNGVTKTSSSKLVESIKVLDTRTFPEFVKNNVGSNRYANGIDKYNNILYIGTKNGLQIVSDTMTQVVQNEILDSKTYILKLLPVKKDILTLGTLGKGVIFYNVKTGEVSQASTKEGLGDDFILDIYRDEDGTIWVKHAKGLSSIDRKEKTFHIKNFGSTNGLKNLVINQIGYYNGNILLSTNNGLYSFDKPSIHEKSKITSSFYFDSFDLAGKNYVIRNKELEIPSNETFSINYNLVSYQLGPKYTYYYRLKNLNNKWIPTASEVISYTGLESGIYELEMYAQNEQGAKTEIASLKINVKDPWYKSNEA